MHRLFIDFKKAYDSVRREVLHNILTEFAVITAQQPDVPAYINCDIQLQNVAPDDGLESETCGALNHKWRHIIRICASSWSTYIHKMYKYYNVFSGRKLTIFYCGGFEPVTCFLNVPLLYWNVMGTLKENRKHLTLHHWLHTAHTQNLYLCKMTTEFW